MTTWWWVRHGPTHAKTMVGWSDVPADLSDTGAISRLDACLPSDALVVSSDLLRAVRTADAIVSDRRRLPHSRDLREIHFGAWEMKTAAEAANTDPETARAYWGDPGDVAPPMGESWNALGARVNHFVETMNTLYDGCHIIAVAHFGVVLTQLQRAARMSAKSALCFQIDNLSVTRLEFTDPHWRVGGVNRLP